MELKKLNENFSVCRVEDYSLVNLDAEYCFIGKTDEEKSLVCITEDVPLNTLKRDDGWKGFRIRGVLDFSLVGILSEISKILADNGIAIFALSTYNTDYVLIKEENYQRALEVLEWSGYRITDESLKEQKREQFDTLMKEAAADNAFLERTYICEEDFKYPDGENIGRGK